MKKIKLYIHAEGLENPAPVEVPPNISVKQLVSTLMALDFVHDKSTYFIEDGDNAIELSDDLMEAHGITNFQHLHCHRCVKVKINVVYTSGATHLFEVRPGTTISKLIKLGAKAFKIDPKVVPTLIMKSENNVTLDDSAHVGTLVHHPHCSLNLILCPKVIIQG